MYVHRATNARKFRIFVPGQARISMIRNIHEVERGYQPKARNRKAHKFVIPYLLAAIYASKSWPYGFTEEFTGPSRLPLAFMWTRVGGIGRGIRTLLSVHSGWCSYLLRLWYADPVGRILLFLMYSTLYMRFAFACTRGFVFYKFNGSLMIF